ncbi:MAG: S-layer homology domain-containing protein [Heliobacteriaceae bacterium]|nr:S-layer homology domain-containing protein [Heliobacteriaceae bacterium]
MKKPLALVSTLVLAGMLSTVAVPAYASNGNAWGNNDPGKKAVNTEKLSNHQSDQNRHKVEKAQKKNIQERVKKSLQVKFQACSNENPDQPLHFADTYQHWAARYIEKMSAIGLLNGYPDNTFKPDRPLTLAEVLSLAMRIAPEDEQTGETLDELNNNTEELAAIPEWVRKDAGKAAKKGLIKLNRFHSAVQASRAQTMVMVAKALGLEPVDTSDLPFKDGLLISKEDIGYILALYQEGIIKGSPNGNFNPNSAITRAEMACLLQKLLDKAVITAVSLPGTATVEQGKSLTLKATVKYADGTSDNKVTWSSSDPALATVENGVVTAAAAKTGTVTITATASRGNATMSADCKVTVVEKEAVTTGTFKATGNVGSHDGKLYEEYRFEVDGKQISLAQDQVKAITLQKDDAAAIELTPNTDSNLWFNVQRESGEYTITVEDKNDNNYVATINWTAPIELVVTATGNKGEHEGNSYVEYKLGNLNLSGFTCMYQLKPDGQVIELTANTDATLWFKTNDQVPGKHIFLFKQNGTWYSAGISI